jgi:hypothetical protein
MPNRAPVVIAVALVLLLAGGALFFFTQSPPDESPAPAPSATPAAPAPTAAPRSAPRPSAPKPSEPVETPEPTPESPTTGTLVIESDVPETSVFIDRVYLGTAPVTARDVKPGQHRLNLSAAGYDGYVETIDVEPGNRTISVSFKEIKLDESIAVVHKHAIGSCKGTLTATPAGLTYATDNKNDGFTAALTDLETFSVDYLEKNLRVKIKDGKTYNFTDAEGNADRLFLFHQNVEKVRQRLLQGKVD